MPARPSLPADRLLALRLHVGLTQQQAAAATGVSISTWRDWERGQKSPISGRLLAVSRALGVPAAALLVEDGVRVVRELQITPATAARVRALGRPEAERVALLLAAGLVDDVLAACRNPRVKAGSRAKPRRTRAEVLAAIAASQARRAGREPEPDPGP